MARSANSLAQPAIGAGTPARYLFENHFDREETMPIDIPHLLLWLFVIAAGLLTGGSLFERQVVTPLWASAPPSSVTAWPHGNLQERFFILVSPAYALLTLAVLAASVWLPEASRPWAQAAGATGVLVIVSTGAFFVPILKKTEFSRGAGLGPEEITTLTRRFVRWGLLRTAVAGAGWLAATCALTRG